MPSPHRLAVLFVCLVAALPLRAAQEFLPKVSRIVFLGDSITYGGQYVDDFELFLFCRFPGRRFEVLNVGLPSETVSGLSEEGHADGKFPRPDLHERLARVLEKTKPDLVFACYGMNDGIYLPLDEARFARFREGMLRLRQKVSDAKASIIHLTPPTFHALAARPQPGPDGQPPASLLGGYNLTLDAYSAWLLDQRKQVWQVIDIHGPMNGFIEKQRQANPDFVFAKDGVHANEAGHTLMAEQIIGALAPEDLAWWQKLRAGIAADPKGIELRKLVRQRGRVLCDAYLNAAGHLRPGMAAGLPIPEAEGKAAELETKIRALVPEIAPAMKTTKPVPLSVLPATAALFSFPTPHR
jgi:lysophospholipase L1-like esterase